MPEYGWVAYLVPIVGAIAWATYMITTRSSKSRDGSLAQELNENKARLQAITEQMKLDQARVKDLEERLRNVEGTLNEVG